MPELTPEQVRAQLASLGLAPQDAEDLEEITHRINALRETLAGIEPAGLDTQEPVTPFMQETARHEP